MPDIYNIFNGGVIESTSKSDLFSLLESLPDNTQKLIRPRDVRDAFLTTWANSSFKLTSNDGDNKYIGIDSGNPADRDVKNKILLGKRNIGSLNVMNTSLLNISDTDIFFFNTKPDGVNQDTTKISILAGTDKTLYLNSPYVESVKDNNKINFNITNPSPGGSLNISSTDDFVNINGVSFPTIQDTTDNVSQDKILKYVGVYPFGKLEWSDMDTSNFVIGATGSETNIYGDPVNLNGFSLEFVEPDTVPDDIGGIEQGDTFESGSMSGQDWALSEVIRKLLYPEIEPKLTFSATGTNGSKYFEVGKVANIVFDYSLQSFHRNNNEIIIKWFIRDNGNVVSTWNVIEESTGPLTISTGDIETGSVNYTDDENGAILPYNRPTTLTYELLASTNNNITINPATSLVGFDFSKKDTIEFVKPTFTALIDNDLSFNSNLLNNIINNSATNKILKPDSDIGDSIDFTINGIGYIYFAQPFEYNSVKQIRDDNGFVIYDRDDPILSSFEVSGSVTPPSPNNFLGGYIVYKTKLRVSSNADFKIEIIY